MYRRSCCGVRGLDSILMRRPDAMADIIGSEAYPDISGTVRFYQTEAGILVVTEVRGLPKADEKCMSPVFGYHIHSGHSCTGNSQDAFADSMAHYNPDNCEHPYHAGDMPPLFSNNGYALSIFLTSRFEICEIVGRTIIIHLHPDDFHTQPSGNSGEKIACGEIRQWC